jgi:hypothetical protein
MQEMIPKVSPWRNDCTETGATTEDGDIHLDYRIDCLSEREEEDTNWFSHLARESDDNIIV